MAMNEARRGYLEISGRAVTPQQLARQTGGEAAEVARLLTELEAAGVYSKDGNGTIFSRRMVEDEKRSALGREFGSRGGNPALHPKDKPTLNPPLYREGLDEPLNSESRPHNPELHEREQPFPEVASRPSLDEVLARAQIIGLAEWKARDWFDEMQGCGWLDFNRRPISIWQSVLNRVKTKWEADGRPSGPPAANAARSASQTPASASVGPKLADVTEYAKEKGDEHGSLAVSWFRYWNERKWKRKNGTAIDWKVELSSWLAKRRHNDD